jgi:hypothetical protein
MSSAAPVLPAARTIIYLGMDVHKGKLRWLATRCRKGWSAPSVDTAASRPLSHAIAKAIATTGQRVFGINPEVS